MRDVLNPSIYKAFRETSKEITASLLPARHGQGPSRRNGVDRSKILPGLAAGSVALRSEDVGQGDERAGDFSKPGWSAGLLLQHATSQRGDRLNLTQKMIPMSMGVTGKQLKLNETLTPHQNNSPAPQRTGRRNEHTGASSPYKRGGARTPNNRIRYAEN